MAIVCKAPHPYTQARYSIFLAGSIEMDTAENWQERVTASLMPYDVLILNPRRDDWDSSWKQTIRNPQFYEQVAWELQAQEDASLIAMYFSPNTQSPITLLELGLFAQSGKLVVCCPEPYWRKGNVDIVCERYGVESVETLDELVEACIRSVAS